METKLENSSGIEGRTDAVNPNLPLEQKQAFLNNKVPNGIEAGTKLQPVGVMKLNALLKTASNGQSGGKISLVHNIESGASFLTEAFAEDVQVKTDTKIEKEITETKPGTFLFDQNRMPTRKGFEPENISAVEGVAFVPPVSKKVESSLEELIANPSTLEGMATDNDTPWAIIEKTLKE